MNTLSFNWQKGLREFAGFIIFVIGMLVLLHASDLNPLWYIKGYPEWLSQFTVIQWLAKFRLLWLILFFIVGAGIMAGGVALLEGKKKDSI